MISGIADKRMRESLSNADEVIKIVIPLTFNRSLLKHTPAGFAIMIHTTTGNGGYPVIK
jgi:hypothetical protein